MASQLTDAPSICIPKGLVRLLLALLLHKVPEFVYLRGGVGWLSLGNFQRGVGQGPKTSKVLMIYIMFFCLIHSRYLLNNHMKRWCARDITRRFKVKYFNPTLRSGAQHLRIFVQSSPKFRNPRFKLNFNKPIF